MQGSLPDTRRANPPVSPRDNPRGELPTGTAAQPEFTQGPFALRAPTDELEVRAEYRVFLRYNLIGGLLWGVGVTLLGFFLGNIPLVANNIEIALLMVVGISILPILIEVVRSKRKSKTSVEV